MFASPSLALAALIAGLASSPSPSPSSPESEEVLRAEQLYSDGFDRDALNAWVKLARARPNDPRSAGWLLDAVRPARRVAERRQVLGLLEEASIAFVRTGTRDHESREPIVRAYVGALLEETAHGCSAFHDTEMLDRMLATYVELFPSSPYAGDVLLARAQRALWREHLGDEFIRWLFIQAALQDFPDQWLARTCAGDLKAMPECAARVDAGRLIERETTSAAR